MMGGISASRVLAGLSVVCMGLAVYLLSEEVGAASSGRREMLPDWMTPYMLMATAVLVQVALLTLPRRRSEPACERPLDTSLLDCHVHQTRKFAGPPAAAALRGPVHATRVQSAPPTAVRGPAAVRQLARQRARVHARPTALHPRGRHTRVSASPTLDAEGNKLKGLKGDYTYSVVVLGDLHLDPRYPDDYNQARDQMLAHVEDFKSDHDPNNMAVVSLGDLGESKDCNQTQQLYSGTTACMKQASDFLGSFGVPFEVVGGNHDLEGLDEFKSDKENLEHFLHHMGKDTPQFIREIAPKVVMIGLGSTKFRDAEFTSHEVVIDDEQLAWFEKTIKEHPSSEGWSVICYSHAPIMGSGLRVLQENHVVNGCCWLNHCQPTRGNFIRIVRENPCIKGWFSGHFHLSHDYQDSITFPDEGSERGHCVFVQVGVMAGRATRDGRRQSRVIRGNADGFDILTVNHKRDGEVRLDSTSEFNHTETPNGIVDAETNTYQHPHDDYDHDNWFSVYTPQDDDGCYVGEKLGEGPNAAHDEVCWWHMANGAVIGVHNGMILEYDQSTLAPLGLVAGQEELHGRKVAVIDSGIKNQDGAQIEDVEQALIMYDGEGGDITVIQPNADGSYWRKIVRNKVLRMKEQRRVKAAKQWFLDQHPEKEDPKVESTWGPYTSTSGTAPALMKKKK